MSKLEPIYMMNIVLYLDSTKTLHKFFCVSKKCKEAVGMLHIIPYRISDNKPTSTFLEKFSKFFPKLHTVKCTLSMLNDIKLPRSVVFLIGFITASQETNFQSNWLQMCVEVHIQTNCFSRVNYAKMTNIQSLYLVLQANSQAGNVFSGRQLSFLPTLKKIVIDCFANHLDGFLEEYDKSTNLKFKKSIFKIRNAEEKDVDNLYKLNSFGAYVGLYFHQISELPYFVILLPYFGYLNVAKADDLEAEKMYIQYGKKLHLYIGLNKKTEKLAIHNTHIQSLCVTGLDCSKNLTVPTNLQNLKLTRCTLPSLDLKYVCLENVTFDNVVVDTVTFPFTLTGLTCVKSCVSTIHNLHLLNLPASKILSVALTLSRPLLPTNLNELIFSSSPVTFFPNIMNCTFRQLKLFRCNELVSVQIPTTVTMLAVCSCKNLTSVGLVGVSLRKIEITENVQLLNVPLVPPLASIYLSKNQLLNLVLPDSIKKVKAVQSRISSRTNIGLTRLSLTACSDMPIFELFPNLVLITLISQLLPSTDFPRSLQSIFLNDLNLSKLDLQNHSNLTSLTVWKCNNLTGITTPQCLIKLDLSRNTLYTNDISKSKSLRELKIVSCRMVEFTLPPSVSVFVNNKNTFVK
ncbi:hypothetical protein EIN_359700 [Entamoeba invadens IP1]|uniref:Leucine-rich repeat containing protein n=1 Tax=Entamoeba invadens IP1 TaxID=370355 RepID=A0A0A1U7Q2_ENTIV|nr:hypothetical protein EIN_359700 [Entamoeba invadens IP1]ELP90877.1 hypothetical protein EIN_359700 [Entamoeba invadens IP1]|eukprot:XP_004257648.1 hypothetical protein EIN_359700 [Entamoeba invadens IP1]